MHKVHLGPRGPGDDESLPELGLLAGVEEKHRYEELPSLGSALCLHCFGWNDDPRHFLPWHWQYVEDNLCRQYENRKEWVWATKQSRNHRRR
jgi:hypothetical protein